MSEQNTRCVLTWRYSDNSAFGVSRVYGDEARAREDLALAQEAEGGKVFELKDVPYFKGRYEDER